MKNIVPQYEIYHILGEENTFLCFNLDALYLWFLKIWSVREP